MHRRMASEHQQQLKVDVCFHSLMDPPCGTFIIRVALKGIQ